MRFTEPNQLAAWATQLSGQEQEEDERPEIVLELIQPLKDRELVTACRTYKPHTIQDFSSRGRPGSRDAEQLNLEPLSRAWRQAAKDVHHARRVTFDLALPTGNADLDLAQRVCWDSCPQDGFHVLSTMDVMTITSTIATGLRMRVSHALQFDLVWYEAEGARQGGGPIASHKKQLQKLAKYIPNLSNSKGTMETAESTAQSNGESTQVRST